MIKRFILLAALILLSLPQCSKKEGPRISGEVTINSKQFFDVTYYIIGYSFTQGKLIDTREDPGPDVTVWPKIEANGDVQDAFLDNPNAKNSFSLTASFDNPDNAENYFSSYKTVNDSSGYTGLAMPIRKNQIWTFRTSSERYVKMLILDVTATRLPEGDTTKPYAETTFRFVYQPDGTRTFPE